jgi:hypothetical protein
MRFCNQLPCDKRSQLRRDIRRIERPGQVPGIINRVERLVTTDPALRSQIVRALRGGLYMEASDMLTEYMQGACPSPELAIHASR